MKAIRTETSVRLEAESQYEQQVLELLRSKGSIESIRFEDDWDSRGYLELNFPTHPWDHRR